MVILHWWELALSNAVYVSMEGTKPMTTWEMNCDRKCESLKILCDWCQFNLVRALFHLRRLSLTNTSDSIEIEAPGSPSLKMWRENPSLSDWLQILYISMSFSPDVGFQKEIKANLLVEVGWLYYISS